MNGKNENEKEVCVWHEVRNNKDWFHAGCINQKVNMWKLCKRKGLTPVKIFLSCPYCGCRVKLEGEE